MKCALKKLEIVLLKSKPSSRACHVNVSNLSIHTCFHGSSIKALDDDVICLPPEATALNI